jgi:hypothetical protein
MSKKTLTFKLIDVIIEIGISFIIMPLLMGIALTNMANTSTVGWSDETLVLWGLLGMIFIGANIIAVISHAKNAGKF